LDDFCAASSLSLISLTSACAAIARNFLSLSSAAFAFAGINSAAQPSIAQHITLFMVFISGLPERYSRQIEVRASYWQ
jgi:hypothetical protein